MKFCVFLISVILIWITSSAKIKNNSFFPKNNSFFPKNISSSSGCNCAGGNVPTFGYEIALGCVGGCGGSPFIFHDSSSTVQLLRAWTGGEHDGLKALYAQLFDGRSETFGTIPANGPSAEIVFSPGETIVGDMELCGNGIGTRTGYIHFKTSGGKEFKVGKENTPYYYPSGNSFLTGFFGQAGSELDHLGFYMMKPVKSASLQNIRYPTLDSYTVGLTPQIYKVSLCNDDYVTSQTQTATFSKETGTSYTWSISLSFTFGGSISVEAGLPEVAKVSTTYHWEVGISSTYSQTVDTKKTVTMQYPVTVPARELLTATFTWWDSKCDVPYTADLVYNFADNSQFTFHVEDSFSGVFITNVQDSYHAVNLTKGQNCATRHFD